MMMTPESLCDHSKHLFEKQSCMLSLWQNLADNFYPERADFTVVRNTGQELADLLIDSYPILARRDMGNSLSAMLRDGKWFTITAEHDPDEEGHRWLEWASERLKKVMYFREAGFVRATKQGDHDYVTFGQCVIQVEQNRHRDGLLYRCWHLRDCAWTENDGGEICTMYRKWRPTAYQLHQFMGDKCHANVKKKLQKHPFEEINCQHIVMPAEQYYGDYSGGERGGYVDIHLDTDNMHVMEETPVPHLNYVVPRFQTIAGSQYAYSPATVVALPDARLIQAMTHTLLEAGERYARPPIIATSRVIRSDVDLSSDGITWVDDEYDERMGAALRPMQQDRGGFPIGLELREDIKETLASAFYLNKLSLPDVGHEMTAYEVAERMKQYRRENLPLFAPMESEYNGQICEMSFELAMQGGLLGSPMDIPESLQGNEVVFRFKSPLTRAEEEEKATRFQQVRAMLAETVQLDPTAGANVDLDTALRQSVRGIGAPSSWLHTLEDVQEQRQAQKMEQAAQMMLENGDKLAGAA